MILGWEEILENPGILRGGSWGSHPSHQSQDDPWMGEILGNPGILRQGGGGVLSLDSP